jgi:uncharacterized protein (TIGR03435 family)
MMVVRIFRAFGLAAILGSSLRAQDAPQPARDAAFDADPSFQAATIKPSDPNESNWGTMVRGHHFATVNTTMNDLIAYAYGVHVKQIVNAPDWFGKERFDLDCVPNTEVLPTRDQFHVMMQKLLGDRFQLKFHHEQRELAVYAITVAKGGPKLKGNAPAPESKSGYGVQTGALTVKNMTVAGLAMVMQRTVLERPVIDRTGLMGRYDVDLKWRPDESQFIQLRGAGGPPSSGA